MEDVKMPSRLIVLEQSREDVREAMEPGETTETHETLEKIMTSRYEGAAGVFSGLEASEASSSVKDTKTTIPSKSVEGWVVIVTGVHEEALEDQLLEAFEGLGQIRNIHLNLDRRTGNLRASTIKPQQTRALSLFVLAVSVSMSLCFTAFFAGFVKGYALVEFCERAGAQRAITEMNGKEILGERVKVNWAFAKPPKSERLRQP